MNSSPEYSVVLYLTMLAAAIAFSLQNASMTISMQFLDVGMVSVLLYLAIPVGYILDWFFLGQQFGALELGGAAIICGVNLIIGVLKVKGIIE